MKVGDLVKANHKIGAANIKKRYKMTSGQA